MADLTVPCFNLAELLVDSNLAAIAVTYDSIEFVDSNLVATADGCNCY